ncbi:hypothetical protein Hanom_Chr09g00852481 [Helianthus anomalus]
MLCETIVSELCLSTSVLTRCAPSLFSNGTEFEVDSTCAAFAVRLLFTGCILLELLSVLVEGSVHEQSSKSSFCSSRFLFLLNVFFFTTSSM